MNEEPTKIAELAISLKLAISLEKICAQIEKLEKRIEKIEGGKKAEEDSLIRNFMANSQTPVESYMSHEEIKKYAERGLSREEIDNFIEKLFVWEEHA